MTIESEDKGREAEVKRNELQNKINQILREFDSKESDIPLTHAYWDYQHQLREIQ